jgi:hypothetical protein
MTLLNSECVIVTASGEGLTVRTPSDRIHTFGILRQGLPKNSGKFSWGISLF